MYLKIKLFALRARLLLSIFVGAVLLIYSKSHMISLLSCVLKIGQN